MTSWEDLFLYEIARSHQHELLESARTSRVLAAEEPTSLRGMLWEFGRRFTRRMTSNQTAPTVDSVSPGRCHEGIFCQRLRARKDAA